MSYQTRDESVEGGRPVLLFQFVQGSNTYRYTSAGEAVTAGGYTWNPEVVVPNEFGHSNDIGKDQLRVDIASSNTLASTFTAGAPDRVTTLTVFRTFTDPVETPITYWKGRVSSVGMEPGRMVLNCDSLITQMRRPGLRALYSKMCRHVLYGRGCNLSSLSFETQVTIMTISGSIVTLPSGIAAYGYWDGGVLQAPDGTSRMIMKHANGRLYLIRKIQSLIDYIAAHPETGANVYLYRGCDHSYTMCKERFNNAGNYGGDPFFSQKNPFTTQVSFV